MASTIALEIPRDVLHTTRMRPEELKCELAFASRLYDSFPGRRWLQLRYDLSRAALAPWQVL